MYLKVIHVDEEREKKLFKLGSILVSNKGDLLVQIKVSELLAKSVPSLP